MIESSLQFPRDISGHTEISYTVQTHDKFIGGVTIRYTTKDRRYIPFPDNTCGFLYYKGPSPGYPDLSGSLRFRVISGSNSFEDGVDLTLPTGRVWQIHLYSVLRAVRHAGFVTKLLEEKLITNSVVKKLRLLPPFLLQSSSQILYKLEDPFVSRLDMTERLFVMSEDGAGSGPITPLFRDSRPAIRRYPYKGMPSYQRPECQLQDI
jgi:hypothetical protein